jgi:hypothetical protein
MPLVGAALLVLNSPTGPRLVALSLPGSSAVGVQPKCIPLRIIRGAVQEHGRDFRKGVMGPCSGTAVMNRARRKGLQFYMLGRSRTTTTSAGDEDEGELEEEGGGCWDNASKATTNKMVWRFTLLIEWER